MSALFDEYSSSSSSSDDENNKKQVDNYEMDFIPKSKLTNFTFVKILMQFVHKLAILI